MKRRDMLKGFSLLPLAAGGIAGNIPFSTFAAPKSRFSDFGAAKVEKGILPAMPPAANGSNENPLSMSLLFIKMYFKNLFQHGKVDFNHSRTPGYGRPFDCAQGLDIHPSTALRTFDCAQDSTAFSIKFNCANTQQYPERSRRGCF